MGLRMSKPHRQKGGMYWYRARVPRDVAAKVSGQAITVEVAGVIRTAKVSKDGVFKVTLSTKDDREAKVRHTSVATQLNAHFEAVRAGPQDLSHKRRLALAGQLYRLFVGTFDEDPGNPIMWANVHKWNTEALTPQPHPMQPLAIGTLPKKMSMAALEDRFGGFTDAYLRKHNLLITEASRKQLLVDVGKALTDAALINFKKSIGDYSEAGNADRFPEMPPPQVKQQAAPKETEQVTFEEVIDREQKRRSVRRSGQPIEAKTIRKFKIAADEYSSFTGSTVVADVDPHKAEDWVSAMLDADTLSTNTVRQRLQNLKTVVTWARQHSLGILFPAGHPLELVVPPPKDSDVQPGERAYTLSEARTVLSEARHEGRPDRRWLPWLCAYSGARINEVAQLTPDDIRFAEGVHFYVLSDEGDKTLKNTQSRRRVPLHPDLIAEGFLDFVDAQRSKGNQRMFPVRSQGNVRDWVRGTLNIKRQNLQPNHGWRHLFEDLAVGAGMQDSAKRYITGRAEGRSEEGYGGSEAVLPGLAAQLAKIPSYLGG